MPFAGAASFISVVSVSSGGREFSKSKESRQKEALLPGGRRATGHTTIKDAPNVWRTALSVPLLSSDHGDLHIYFEHSRNTPSQQHGGEQGSTTSD
jgi:hypothetical protein